MTHCPACGTWLTLFGWCSNCADFVSEAQAATVEHTPPEIVRELYTELGGEA